MKGFNIDLVNLESQFLKLIIKRRHRFLLFIFAMILLVGLYYAPYINLFFSPYLFIFIVALLIPIILDIDAKPLFTFAVGLLICSLLVWFIDPYIAESMAEYIFIVLFSGSLRYLFT